VKIPPMGALLLVSAGLVYPQTGPAAPTDRADLTADALTRTGSLLTGVGHVRAKIGNLVLRADEGTVSSESGALELRGHVTVTLPARSDRNLFRYDSHVLITEAPVLLSADRMSVSDAVLRGSGHVLVKTDEAVLQVDQVELLLRTGDGRTSGDIRLDGKPLDDMPSAPRSHVFPPDVIK